MSKLREVGFPCRTGDGSLLNLRDRNNVIGFQHEIYERRESVELDRDQVRELVTRLTEWLGDAPPASPKWTDL